MSGLDFTVHRILYTYGLSFSYDWAILYWGLFGCVFLVFSAIVGLAYWLASSRSRKDAHVSIGLSLSIGLLFCGGLEDVIWFTFWGGGMPSCSVMWWWTPWCRMFGHWDSSCQLCLLSVVLAAIVLSWIHIARS